MKNPEKDKAITNPGGDEIESLLFQVLREDGKTFPIMEEDIRNLEADMDPDDVEEIAVPKLLARVRGQKLESSENIVVPLFGQVSVETKENLAAAARNGGSVSDEARLQMNEDRNNAEKQREARQ